MEQRQENILNRINEWLDKTFSPKGKVVFLGFIVLMISSCVFYGMQYFQKQNTPKVLEEVDIESETPDEVSSESGEVEIAIDDSSNDKMVSIAVEDLGRANPFLPDSDNIAVRQSSLYGYSLMAPPETLNSNSDASKVLTTKVSGILYDSTNPSAILNIEGSDYVVRSGDYINNYKVLSISKDLVTVQLGKNVYKAGVGQIMSEDEGKINYNNVYNLQNRFGGAKQ